MVPTDYDRNGVPMTGANDVQGRRAEVAAESLSTANIGPTATASKRPLPASSCTLCRRQVVRSVRDLPHRHVREPPRTQMQTWDEEVGVRLTAAAGPSATPPTGERVCQIAVADAAINGKDQADWNASELAFQSAFTNRSYIESEGSWASTTGLTLRP